LQLLNILAIPEHLHCFLQALHSGQTGKWVVLSSTL